MATTLCPFAFVQPAVASICEATFGHAGIGEERRAGIELDAPEVERVLRGEAHERDVRLDALEGRVGVEEEDVETGIEIELAHELDRLVVLARLRPAPERLQPLVGVRFDADVDADAVEPVAKDPEDVGVAVGRPGLDHGGEAANFPRLERVRQRAEALRVPLVARDEEVVVVEDEDGYVALCLERAHLVGDVLHFAEAVAFPGEALLLPRGDAAEGAVRVAPAARDERRDPLRKAGRGLAAPIGPRQARDVRQDRVRGAKGSSEDRSGGERGRLLRIPPLLTPPPAALSPAAAAAAIAAFASLRSVTTTAIQTSNSHAL